MKTLARLVLYSSAAVFLGFGLLFMAAPAQLTTLVQVELPTPIGMMEIRGVYGGLFCGLGVFFGMSAMYAELFRAGLIGLATVMGGLVLGRSIGFAIDGPSIAFIYLLYAGEVTALAISVAALRRNPGAARVPR